MSIPSPRRSWLLTHAIGGSTISYDMFKTSSIDRLSSIDECHYTSDSAVFYTYLHFAEQITKPMLASFMEKLRTEHNVLLFDLFGYDAIFASSRENDLTDHPGFKMIFHHYKTKHPNFKQCTDGKPEVSKGLLRKFDSISRVKELVGARNKKLLSFVESMERENQESQNKTEMINVLQEQMLELEARLEMYSEMLGDFRFSCHVMRSRIEDYLDNETRNMILADALGKPLRLC